MGSKVCSTCQPVDAPVAHLIIIKQFVGEQKKYINEIRSKFRKQMQSQQAKQHVLSNGHIYKGRIEYGKKEGYGEYYVDTTNAYFGMFKDDYPSGEGIMIKNSNNFIKSNFIKGVPNGQSDQKVNRTYFHGHILNGIKSKGVLITDQYKYQGTFSQDGYRFQGYGIIQYDNGDRYEGDFKNGLYHGDGTYQNINKQTYKGEWKNGLYDGKGVFKWENNRWYEGYYKAGVKDGWGKLVDGQNGSWTGLWENGMLKNGKSSTQNPINTITVDKQKINSHQRKQNQASIKKNSQFSGFTIQLF